MIKRSHAFTVVLVALIAVLVLSFTGILTVNILKMNSSQLTLSAIIFFVLLATGLGWKFILDWTQSDGLITWGELIVGALIVGIVFSAVGVNIGWKIALNNKLSYNEYWNGWELQAVENDVTCTRDGGCVYTYACDPYIVLVPYTYTCGKSTCTGLRPETRYHSCPYVTVESTHIVVTTLGDYTIDSHVFASHPVEWRAGSGIPASVQRGPSQFWLDAKARVDSGRPGPVTQRNKYDNYLLASDTSIFKEYSSQIDAYRAAGELPDLQYGIQNFYQADKVYFVGYRPSNPGAWEKADSYLNGSFGTELQGDLHLIVVQNADVTSNPDAYIIALKAYWQSYEFWGKNAMSKNSVIVVLGTTDGQTVAWARATTGMPIGNEAMITAIQNHMAGTPLTPDAVLGTVNGEFYQKVKDDGTTKLAVRGIGENGALRRILWGMDDPATVFARVSMSANDASDNGTGFAYLKDQIKPDFGQQLTIVLVFLFLGLVLWGAEAYLVGDPR